MSRTAPGGLAATIGLVVLLVIGLMAAPGVRPASATELFTDGFETGDLSRWTASKGIVVQSQHTFGGTFAARTIASSAWVSRTLPQPVDDLSVAFQAKFVTRGSAVILERAIPTSGPWIVQLLVNNSGKLAYRNNVTDVTRVSGFTVATGRWYAVEIHLSVAGAASAVEISIDGVTVPELSRTENLGSTPVASFELGNRPTGRAFDLAIDDVTATSGDDGGSSSCPADWTSVPMPSALRALTGVSAIGEDDAWAVGFLKGQQAAPTTVHWDGSAWRTTSVPGVGDFRSAFNAVDAVTATDVWAVGYLWDDAGENAGKAYRTVTQRWTGATWNIVASPNQGTGSNVLVDVDGRTASDAWAVGYYLDGNVKKTLVQRWDGSAWRLVSAPTPGTSSNGLTGVAAVSASEAWAVGYRGDGVGYEPLILRWNGTSWIEQDASELELGDEAILTGVTALGPDDVWVVGYVNGPNGYRAMTGHLGSGTWRYVAPADPGGAVAIPQDVVAASGGAVWWAGLRHGDAAGSESTLIERHRDDAWEIVTTPNASPDDNALYAITSTPGTERLWAVGRSEGDGMALTACPDATTTTASSSDPGLTSIGDAVANPQVPEDIVTAEDVQAGAAAIDVVAADVAGSVGMRFQAHTFPPTVFDHDADGWPDVMLNRHYEDGSALYRNRGDGTFAPVRSFPRLDRHGCAAGDANGDGKPDLYCTTGANYGTDAKANELWLQTDGGWEDRAAEFRALDPFGRGRTAVFLDADRDGYLDLYVGNIRERGDGVPSPNRFFLGTGSSFVPAQTYGLDVELRVGCARTADFDGDAFPDLLVCTNAGPKLYRNDAGAEFDDATPSLAPALKGSDGVFADVDGDGMLDLAMVQAGYVRIWLQTATGTFVKRADIAQPGAQGVAAGDVNLDGLPDLYVLRGSTTTATNAPDVMLLNGGNGVAYTAMTMPGSPGGIADSVEPIDHDRNGQTDFLVMNGNGLHNQAGYTQLIAFFPA